MSQIKSDVEQANAAYAGSFDKGDLALPPARGFLILTCMDARLDPAKYAGLAEGDAHVVRNAGGRASDDAIRSLVISHKLLGTREWFVIHHTDCGMLFFDDAAMADLLAGSLETAELTESGFQNASEPGFAMDPQLLDLDPALRHHQQVLTNYMDILLLKKKNDSSIIFNSPKYLL
ncbi:MAG: carbonic anhydrase [Pseudomonadota bacterium]